MERLGLVAARPARAYLAPFAFLLAVTIAVVLVHGARDRAQPAAPPHMHHAAPVPHRLDKVAGGDTLSGIAAKTHVPLIRIRALNPHVSPTQLFIGEKLRLR
jgi:hypothetical protein